jgi:hypothetical protein
MTRESKTRIKIGKTLPLSFRTQRKIYKRADCFPASPEAGYGFTAMAAKVWQSRIDDFTTELTENTED